jgi:hypothetical protein
MDKVKQESSRKEGQSAQRHLTTEGLAFSRKQFLYPTPDGEIFFARYPVDVRHSERFVIFFSRNSTISGREGKAYFGIRRDLLG